MSNPVKDNQLQMENQKPTFYTNKTVSNKEAEIKRVLDEIISRMFEESPIVPINQRRSIN